MVRILPNGDIVQDNDPRVAANNRSTAQSSGPARRPMVSIKSLHYNN
jgi:hypothetical protein